MLSDWLIEDYSKQCNMITPFMEENLQPCSYDLTLDTEFLGPLREEKTDVVEEGFDGIVLRPQEFVLGSTVEEIKLPRNIYARVEGKSSLGRIGLLIHSTAGFIDPNFQGNVTLELYNLGRYPIMLDVECKIAQICFGLLENEPKRVYGECGNHYQGQSGVTESVVGFNEKVNCWEVKNDGL